MEFAQFDCDSKEELKNLLIESCNESQGPYGDIEIFNEHEHKHLAHSPDGAQEQKQEKKRGFKRREQKYVVRDLILALCLCHNVTPVFPDENDP